MMQSKQSIASLFQTVLNMFKRWCNQNKSFISMLSKQVFPFSKDDAIKTSYCITIFKQSWTCFKYDEALVLAGLGWPGLSKQNFIFFFSKSFPWQRSFKNRKSSRLKRKSFVKVEMGCWLGLFTPASCQLGLRKKGWVRFAKLST